MGSDDNPKSADEGAIDGIELAESEINKKFDAKFIEDGILLPILESPIELFESLMPHFIQMIASGCVLAPQQLQCNFPFIGGSPQPVQA